MMLRYFPWTLCILRTASRCFRCQLPSLFHIEHFDEARQWVVTSAPHIYMKFDQMYVLATATVAMDAADKETLRLLYKEGIIDPSIWRPPCKDSGKATWKFDHDAQKDWYSEVFRDFLVEDTLLATDGPEYLQRNGVDSFEIRRMSGMNLDEVRLHLSGAVVWLCVCVCLCVMPRCPHFPVQPKDV